MDTYIHSYRDVAEASLVAQTELEFATWLARRGTKIICHKGRHWMQAFPGFYATVHPLARLGVHEATRPAALCWGFRTSLRDQDADQANGSLPLHLLSDIDTYTWQAISSRYRNKLRNLRKQVRVVELHKPDLLLDQGYEILRSANTRNNYGRVTRPAIYRKYVEKYYATGHGLVIGGLLDGKLIGYLTGHAVGMTAYVDDLFLDSQHLRTNISLGLFFEWVQICRRTVAIREVVHGLHAREAPGLCHYKDELGLSMVHLPTRIWFAPMTGTIVKTLRPHAYYRLTGHD
jgi:hypothetical protein